jgi:hypothetical protein
MGTPADLSKTRATFWAAQWVIVIIQFVGPVKGSDWRKRYEFRSQPLTGRGYDKPTYLASSDDTHLLGRKTHYLPPYTLVYFFKEFFLGFVAKVAIVYFE